MPLFEILALVPQITALVIDAVERVRKTHRELERKRVAKREILGLVEDGLNGSALWSPLVASHRASVLLFADRLIDVTVEGINLLGATGERIEFDPTPIEPEGGAQ